MEINATLIKKSRLNRGWTQQQLAEIASVSLRTIQRIERTGSASNESVSSLCASFELKREDLLIVPRVASSDMQIVRLGGLHIIVMASLLLGGVIGALIMYWFA